MSKTLDNTDKGEGVWDNLIFSFSFDLEGVAAIFLSRPLMFESLPPFLQNPKRLLSLKAAPQHNCAYAFYKDEECLYVGWTDNLRNRLTGHPRIREIGFRPVIYYWDRVRASTEGVLIEELKPKLNKQPCRRDPRLDGIRWFLQTLSDEIHKPN